MRTTSGERRLVSWSARLRLAGIALTLLLFAVAAQQAYQHGVDIHQAVALLHSWREHFWAAPAFIGSYVVLTSLFAPGSFLNLIAGAAWGFADGVWINLIACNVSCSAHFWGARLLARTRLRRLLAGSGIEELDARASQNGFGAVLFVRMLPLPMVLANGAVGVSTIRWRDFVLGSFIGTLPMVLAYTFFASAIVEGSENAGEEALLRTIAGAVFLATIGLISHLLRRRVMKRSGGLTPR